MAKSATMTVKMLSTAGTGFFYVKKRNPRKQPEKMEKSLKNFFNLKHSCPKKTELCPTFITSNKCNQHSKVALKLSTK